MQNMEWPRIIYLSVQDGQWMPNTSLNFDLHICQNILMALLLFIYVSVVKVARKNFPIYSKLTIFCNRVLAQTQY